ncbi:MAG: hypothetical protein PQJ35_00725 [Sphaerochaetaceae bacterium]|nr:hypothetical protein [Sphaerochaetaceae bacterium]
MDWDVVYSYTRKQALEDGVLIDVTAQAKETGFKIPTAVTSSLWYSYIIPKDIPGQSIEGRLHDVLWLLFLKARGSEESTIFFDVIFQMTEEKTETVKVKAIIGPGDDPKPVLTILLDFED